MQVKKEEVRLKILETATDEFLKKGYENASMRTIAKRAHTTLGNIYHYYENKEVLLETILMPTIENIETMMQLHIENGKTNPIPKELAYEYAEHLDEHFEHSELMCFLDKKIVILLRLESSHLLERKENILKLLKEHLQEHFKLSDDAHYTDIVLNMLIECVKHVLIEHEDQEEAKAEFIKFFKLLCTGIVGQMI